MSKRNASCLERVIVLLLVIGIWAGMAALVGIWTDRNLDFWVSYHKGVPTNVPFGVSWAVSLLIPLAILANVIAEVARWFI